MSAIELSIPALSCGHCVQSVQRALQGLPLQRLSIDLTSKKVRFEAEESLLPELLSRLDEEGYPASRIGG